MKILFFASIKEALDTDEENWTSLDGVETVQDLLHHLHKRGERWQENLDSNRVLVAINQEMAKLDSAIQLNDEVAFFPPVTGG